VLVWRRRQRRQKCQISATVGGAMFAALSAVEDKKGSSLMDTDEDGHFLWVFSVRTVFLYFPRVRMAAMKFGFFLL
jgi:hypothetical protein